MDLSHLPPLPESLGWDKRLPSFKRPKWEVNATHYNLSENGKTSWWAYWYISHKGLCIELGVYLHYLHSEFKNLGWKHVEKVGSNNIYIFYGEVLLQIENTLLRDTLTPHELREILSTWLAHRRSPTVSKYAVNSVGKVLRKKIHEVCDPFLPKEELTRYFFKQDYAQVDCLLASLR